MSDGIDTIIDNTRGEKMSMSFEIFPTIKKKPNCEEIIKLFG